MLPKAILLDLDDTILVEEKAGDIAWERICELSARETGLYSGKVFNGIVSDIRHRFWDDPQKRATLVKDIYQARMTIVRQALSELNCDNKQLADSIVRRYTALKMEVTDFVPDAEATIKYLKSKGIKLAVLTNGEGKEQRARIDKFGLSNLIHACLIAGELGFGKPDPRVYQLALNKLNVKTDEAWMVGDRLESDILGAKRLGIFPIWFDSTRKGLPADAEIKPDKTINEIKELLTI
ncbi:MAG: HAD family hydrolase [Dehalococcoidales bacterium]|nr:HAD family hydrolase [Dehalococcoidales bacterium]